MRSLVPLVFLLATLPGHAAPPRYVNLEPPGAWEALQRERPDHFRVAEEVIRTAQVETCETLPKILEVRLAIDSVTCSSFQLLTSLPPKRHLTFSLEVTGFDTVDLGRLLGPEPSPNGQETADGLSTDPDDALPPLARQAVSRSGDPRRASLRS